MWFTQSSIVLTLRLAFTTIVSSLLYKGGSATSLNSPGNHTFSFRSSPAVFDRFCGEGGDLYVCAHYWHCIDVQIPQDMQRDLCSGLYIPDHAEEQFAFNASTIGGYFAQPFHVHALEIFAADLLHANNCKYSRHLM